MMKHVIENKIEKINYLNNNLGNLVQIQLLKDYEDKKGLLFADIPIHGIICKVKKFKTKDTVKVMFIFNISGETYSDVEINLDINLFNIVLNI